MKTERYLEKILTAKVYDVAIETPLDAVPAISRRLGNHVLIKREDKQPVFSFKLRGAYNKMVRLPAEKLRKGVICASAGNHAQGVALAVERDVGLRPLGCQALGAELAHLDGVNKALLKMERFWNSQISFGTRASSQDAA